MFTCPGRKAHVSTSVYEFDSVIIGQHIKWQKHKCINAERQRRWWIFCKWSTVAISKGRYTYQEILRMHSFFLMHNTILPFVTFNDCGTQCLSGPGTFFIYSAVLRTYVPGIYLSPCIYMSPALMVGFHRYDFSSKKPQNLVLR